MANARTRRARARKRKTEAERAFEILADLPRRFRSVRVPWKSTDYIEVTRSGGAWAVKKNGGRKVPLHIGMFALEQCLELVKKGAWEEIDGDQ